MDVAEDGQLSNPRKFADVIYPDGMVVDKEGNLYITSADGVEVFRPDGSHVGTIVTDRQPANCALLVKMETAGYYCPGLCLWRKMPIAGVLVYGQI